MSRSDPEDDRDLDSIDEHSLAEEAAALASCLAPCETCLSHVTRDPSAISTFVYSFSLVRILKCTGNSQVN